MEKKFVVTASPFVRNNLASTQSIMRDVCIALLPAVIASVYFFGLKALILLVLSTVSAVFFEALFQKLGKSKIRIYDYSAAVTGLLVGLNLPSSAPYWMPIFGSLIAIVLVKQLFGGIGQNFMNPAMIARTIMFLSWTALMSARILPQAGNFFAGFSSDVDLVSVATPLAHGEQFGLWDLLIGNIPGMMGETSKLALLLGGLYLLYRRVIDWRLPVSIITTVFILSYLHTGIIYTSESGVQNALGQILSGGLFIGAFFMATDYVTSPLHRTGRIVGGILCGIIIFVIRAYGSYPEGTSFAVLFLNVMTPLIDRYTRPKSFGEA